MSYLLGHSNNPEPAAALTEACRAFSYTRPELVLFMADGQRFAAFTHLLREQFPDSIVAGISTYVYFCTGRSGTAGLTVVALTGSKVHAAAGRLGEVALHPIKYKKAAAAVFKELQPWHPSFTNSLCLVLNPARTGGEELVLDTLAELLNDFKFKLPVAGGCASSEICGRGVVSLNGQVYADSSVFILLHLEGGRLQVFKENMYQPLPQKFTVTRADSARHILYELDGHPAAEVLSRSLQVTPDQLLSVLPQHPLGRLKNGNEVYICDCSKINSDGSILTLCRIFNQTRLSLLQQRPHPEVLQETLAQINSVLPHPDGSLIFNCYGRTKMFLEQNWLEEFTRRLDAGLGTYAGLTSHGEELDTLHLNLTMLILAFKEDL